MKNAYVLMKMTDPTIRTLSKFLQVSVLRNSKVCQIIQPGELKPLPGEVRQLIDSGQIDDDDEYLLQTYYSTDVTLLVTTDVRLHTALAQLTELKTILKSDFLHDYLKK